MHAVDHDVEMVMRPGAARDEDRLMLTEARAIVQLVRRGEGSARPSGRRQATEREGAAPELPDQFRVRQEGLDLDRYAQCRLPDKGPRRLPAEPSGLVDQLILSVRQWQTPVPTERRLVASNGLVWLWLLDPVVAFGHTQTPPPIAP